MNHRMKKAKLNRTSAHRQAMLMNMSVSLLQHEHIKTTLPKAKALRPYVEKLITMSKNPSLHIRRRLISILQSPVIVEKLFSTIGARYATRPGGYTRIMKAGYRYGDSAPMAVIELVDNEKLV